MVNPWLSDADREKIVICSDDHEAVLREHLESRPGRMYQRILRGGLRLVVRSTLDSVFAVKTGRAQVLSVWRISHPACSDQSGVLVCDSDTVL